MRTRRRTDPAGPHQLQGTLRTGEKLLLVWGFVSFWLLPRR